MTPADAGLQVLVLWAAALTTLFNFAFLIWGVFSGPARRNAGQIEALSGRLGALDQRVSGMEHSMRVIPAKEELHELELAMTRLQGEMKTMSEAMRGQAEIMKRLEHLVGRHEDHLIRK